MAQIQCQWVDKEASSTVYFYEWATDRKKHLSWAVICLLVGSESTWRDQKQPIRCPPFGNSVKCCVKAALQLHAPSKTSWQTANNLKRSEITNMVRDKTLRDNLDAFFLIKLGLWVKNMWPGHHLLPNVSHLCLNVSFDLIFVEYDFFPFGARTGSVIPDFFFPLSAFQSVFVWYSVWTCKPVQWIWTSDYLPAWFLDLDWTERPLTLHQCGQAFEYRAWYRLW